MLSETEDKDGNRKIGTPSLSPDFLIETYLDHQVSDKEEERGERLLMFCFSFFGGGGGGLGRTILSHVRCKLNDLPIKSDGSLRYDGRIINRSR